MSQPAIEVTNLGKEYRIGVREAQAGSFRELVSHTMKLPFKRLQRLREKAAADDSFWAARGVNFTVNRGEVMGIIGKNGAGKSTLLKMLSRITEPTEGRVVYRGRVASLLEVGTGFHPELTGRENIYLNGSILGMTRQEITQKFDEIVEFAEIEKFLDTPVKRYSSGMYVRLAFAVAAHLEPEILVVDEVLAVGDVAFQRKCLGKMQEVAAGEGRTVLFVSHQMPSVRQLCDRALIMEHGQMVNIGEADPMVDEYLARAAKHDQLVYDVSERPLPRRATGRAKVISARFDPEDAKRFYHDQELNFLVEVEGREPVDECRIAVVVHSLKGFPLGSTYGSDHFELRPGKRKTVRVTIPPMGLAPGPYHMEIKLGRGDPKTGAREMDYVDEVLHFEVLPKPVGGGAVEHWTDSFGSIRLPDLRAEEHSRSTLS